MAPSDKNLDPEGVADKAKDLLGKGKDAVPGQADDGVDSGTTTESVTETEAVVVSETTETVVTETVVTETVETSEVIETEVIDAPVAETVVAKTVETPEVVKTEVVEKSVSETVMTDGAVTETVEVHDVVETAHVTTERTSSLPSVILGLVVLFSFIVLGLLLSQCGGDDEAVGTAGPVTTAVQRTVVTVDPQTGIDPVRKALDANGYDDVGVGLDDNGRVKITGEMPDVAAKLDASSVATAALPAGVLLSNQLTVAPAPALTPPDREDAVRSALDGGGFDDIDSETGDPFVLTGVVPTAEAKAEAGTLAETAADPFGVDNRITVVAPAIDTAGAPTDGGITLTGEVPNDDVRAAMVAAAAAEYGADNVTDQMTTGDGDLGDFVVRAEVSSRGAQRRLQATGQSIATAGGYTFVDEITRPNSSDLADELNALVELEPILFDVNSAGIRTESRVTLDKAVVFFEEYEGSVEVGGHTDSDGSDGANQSLSEARAASVRQYLVDQGVDTDRLSAAGFGEGQPVATNDTPEGRQLNRRIEFQAT